MKNISLIKVTFAVVATALASSLVSAEDVMPKSIAATTSTLFEQLDTDKNGLLSLVETEGHKQIHAAFTKIDSNDDATISKNELAGYIKQ